AWMPDSKWCVSLISCALVIGLGWTAVRGLALGKWVHTIAGLVMLLVYGTLITLPFIGLARGELRQYHPLQIAAPTVSMFYCVNIFTKLSIGALSGFEYVAILAGETRSPARDIGRSVIIASPVIALAFILSTSSVLAFVGIIRLVIAISSQIGAGIQEAFQLVDNAANVFYGVVYLLLFAIPIFGTASVRSGAPVCLRVASACGCVVSSLAIFFTVYPII